MNKLLIAIGLLGFGGCLPAGCSIMNTGPQVAQLTVDAAKSALVATLDQYHPDQQSLNVDLDGKNPEYEAVVFVGVGTYVRLNVRAIGIGASVNSMSSSHGVGTVDTELRKIIAEIMDRKSINEQERANLIAETIAAFVRSRTDVAGPPIVPVETPVVPVSPKPPQ